MDDTSTATSISVGIRDAGLVCEITICAGADPETVGEAVCVSELRGQGVEITREVSERLAELLTLHGEDPDSPHAMVVAQGQAPVHGQDGRLEILPKFDAELAEAGETASEPGESGVGMDHHVRSAFALVESGEQIGTLHPPQPGEDGRSVTGETIVAKSGKTLLLNTDESVVVRESGAIVAAISGVVQIEGRKIRVLQRLDVHGSIDFSTGNIDFPGDVVINKSVKDCFHVQARRDITVHGLVEAASINAGRDLHLLGGAACREKGTLCAERDIEARYLNECDLSAGRSLVVEKEIINANIAVGADLISPNCTIIGGMAYVTGVCEVAEIGSERNIPTMLSLGKGRDADRLSGKAESLLQTIGDRLVKSQAQHDQLQNNTAKLTPAQAEQLTELQFEIGTYRRLEGSLTGAVEGMQRAVEGVAAVDLTVLKRMWRGVTILLGVWEAFIEEPIKGPFKITCNQSGKPILTDLTADSSVELSTVARVRSRIEDEGADEAIAA